MKEIKIALAGNPNCGKTTLFNDLTGSSQYVGNWPGVTVEKKDGRLKGRKDVVIQDLPGIYSLSPYSLEEVVARNYLVRDRPDAILNIVDGSNIERNLYLTTQLLETGIPVVVAVNMMDIVRKRGDEIDLAKLSKALGCPVTGISAVKGEKTAEAANIAVEAAVSKAKGEHPHIFTGSVEHALAHIEESIQSVVPQENLRWYAIKIFERDAKAIEPLGLGKETLSHLEAHIRDCEKEMDDDAESIITAQRYEYIQKIVGGVCKKNPAYGKITVSDRIDKVVTNRWLALPLFACVIWFMYWVSVSTLGGWLTDWANDGVFGEKGWHVAGTVNASPFCSEAVNARNAEIAKEAEAAEAENAKNAVAIAAWKEKHADETEKAAAVLKANIALLDAEYEAGTNSLSAVRRMLAPAPAAEEENPEKEVPEPAWEQADGAFSDAEKRIGAWTKAYERAWKAAKGEDAAVPENEEGEIEIDESIAASVWAPVVFDDDETGEIDRFEIVVYRRAEADKDDETISSYLEAKETAEPDPGDYGLWVPSIPNLLGSLFDKAGIGEESMARKVVFDGIVGPVGTVLGFVPQIVIIFLFLAFFEGCGYMARIAFIMDRIFRRFGLSGKSFIPMIVGMGCGVPAVMAARTIEARRDRRMTIMLGTYIPCGAKYAIIAMFTTAFFDGNPLVATSMYFLGVAVIILGGIALKKLKAFRGDPAPFVMELPAYHMPTLRDILLQTWERARGYIVKAGTLIFAASVALWVLMSFDWSFSAVELEESMLHDIGTWIAWLFAPLGFGEWQGAVASVTSEIAKEEAVSTLSQLAGNADNAGLAQSIYNLFAGFNGPQLAVVTGLSFMVMNLFDPPCMVAIAVTFREMGEKRWGWAAVGFQFIVGYSLALIVYQLGAFFFCGAPFTAWTGAAFAVLAGISWMVFRPVPKDKLG